MFWVLLSQSQQFLGTNSCWIKNISEGDCNSLLVKLHQPYNRTTRMVMVEKPYKTMRDFSEAEQKSLVVEHITATAIDHKPLRKFAEEHRIIERSYRKIQRRQLCKMLYDLICAEVITDLTLVDKHGELNLVATVREAKVLEFDLWYKRIPGGRRAQPSVDVVIDEEVCLALDGDLFHSLKILGQSRLIIRVTKADLTDRKKFISLKFDEWYEEMSKERTVSYLLSSGLKPISAR